jgi:acyl carrier protein phosphodiesterase
VNHLAHFALAGDELIVGSFLGDYIKGRLEDRFTHNVERGIRLHRAIDAYTDSHDVVRRSQQRFDPGFRRYAGIMTDVIYDCLLARTWADFYDQPLHDFSTRTLRNLLDAGQHLPEKAMRTATRMHEHNSLAGYGSDEFVAGAFSHLSTRLTRTNPLDIAYSQFEIHLTGLESDFADFYPELMDFCEKWKQTN